MRIRYDGAPDALRFAGVIYEVAPRDVRATLHTWRGPETHWCWSGKQAFRTAASHARTDRAWTAGLPAADPAGQILGLLTSNASALLSTAEILDALGFPAARNDKILESLDDLARKALVEKIRPGGGPRRVYWRLPAG